MHFKRWSLFIGIILILASLILSSCQTTPTTTTATTTTSTAKPTTTTPAVTTSTTTAAPTTTTPVTATKLTFATFQASTDYWAPAMLEWAKDFETQTGGRYKIEFNWGGGMGAAADYYNMLTNGLFDITAWQPTSKPGVFPISELITLPIEAPSISVPSMAFREVMLNGYLDKEFANAKILVVWAGAGNFISQNKKAASTIADMQGIKIATGGGFAIDVLKAAGTTPVSMAVGERYISIEKGLVDGTYGTWAAFYTNRFYEILKYATEPGLCSFPFTMVMNKATYDKFPADVKKIVDDMSKSDKYTKMIGDLGDANIEKGKKAFADAGGKISQWNAVDYATMGTTLAPLWTKTIDADVAKGYQANEALNVLYKALKESGVNNPFVGYTPK